MHLEPRVCELSVVINNSVFYSQGGARNTAAHECLLIGLLIGGKFIKLLFVYNVGLYCVGVSVC